MSDSPTLTEPTVAEPCAPSDAAPTPTLAPTAELPAVETASPAHATAPPPTPDLTIAPEVLALLGVIAGGFVLDASAAARTAALDACQRLAFALGPVHAPPSGAAARPAAARSPIAEIVETIRRLKLSPDQLIDLAIQRMRAALPTGTAVTPSEPVRFHLVAVPSAPPPAESP